MSPDQLRDALGALRWSQRGLAEILECDDRLVRRWIGGEMTVPPDVAEWLLELSNLHTSLPPPAAWRRRATGRKAAGVDTMPVEPTIEVSSVSWDWQPGGKVTARGTVAISRGGSALPPITLHFEIPAETPPRNALADPRNWVLTRLRQAFRPSRAAKSGSDLGQTQSS
jgi:hypothetical protein